MEELSPELWEELGLDGAAAEYDLYMQDLADEEAEVLNKTLINPQGYLRPQDPPRPGRRSQLQTYPEPLCQVWKPNTLDCIGI